MWKLLFRQRFDKGLGEPRSNPRITGGLEEGWRTGEGAGHFQTQNSSPAMCSAPVQNYAQHWNFVTHRFCTPHHIPHTSYLLWWQTEIFYCHLKKNKKGIRKRLSEWKRKGNLKPGVFVMSVYSSPHHFLDIYTHIWNYTHFFCPVSDISATLLTISALQG